MESKAIEATQLFTTGKVADREGTPGKPGATITACEV